MKYIAGILLLVMTFSVAGCAKKTASEQLKEDMQKAAKKMDNEVKGFLNS